MQKAEFTNPKVAAIVEAMQAAKPDFNENGKGQQWRAILFSVSQSFPEERQAVLQVIHGPKAKPQAQGGGARIHRAGRSGAVVEQGCEDCPGGGGTMKVPQGRGARVIKGTHGQPQEPAADDPATAFATVEDVLERFDNDAAIMTAFCGTNGIEIGQAKKPETIAGKIVAHYNPPK